MTARVLVVDDEHHMRALLRTLLEIEEPTSIVLVGEASDGSEALQVWRELRESDAPDVVVLDHRMPRISGLDAAREILAERPEQIVVLFSAFLDEDLRREASLIGVAACVDKREAESLPRLIVDLHESRRRAHSGPRRRFASTARLSRLRFPFATSSPPASLTSRSSRALG